MRMMVKVEWPVEAGNAVMKDGSMPGTIQAILEEQKPEAAYFIAFNGKRTGLIFLEVEDASQIPAVAEPWFLAFDASVDFYPAMNAEDLKKAGPAIEQAVKKYA
jgi:hypothetical protein